MSLQIIAVSVIMIGCIIYVGKNLYNTFRNNKEFNPCGNCKKQCFKDKKCE